MEQEVVIDCPYCSVRVKTLSNAWIGGDVAFFIVNCPTCKSVLFGESEQVINEQNQLEWDTLKRLWPIPSINEVSSCVPKAAKKDIMDAQKCLSHGICSASAVLCGRALERLINEKVGKHMIGKGIAELKSKGIIDQRLFDWAEALRKERNIGAHGSEQDISIEDAQDVIDFTIAIFDYVYTLSEKYQKYIERKSN